EREAAASAEQRDAVVARIAAAEHVAVDEDIAADPVVAAGRAGAAGIARRGLHPPLEREAAADVDRPRRRVERDLDAIDVAAAGAEEAQRAAAARRRRARDGEVRHAGAGSVRPRAPAGLVAGRARLAGLAGAHDGA